MFCEKCGKQIEDYGKCPFCGQIQHSQMKYFEKICPYCDRITNKQEKICSKCHHVLPKKNIGFWCVIGCSILGVFCFLMFSMVQLLIPDYELDITTNNTSVNNVDNIVEITDSNIKNYMNNLEKKIETLPNMEYKGYYLYYTGGGEEYAGAELLFTITKLNIQKVSSEEYINWLNTYIKPLYSNKPLFPVQATILFEDNTALQYAFGMTVATNKCEIKNSRYRTKTVPAIYCKSKSDIGEKTEKVFTAGNEEEWKDFLEYAFWAK